MSCQAEIEEELESIEAILIEGLNIERRPDDGRPLTVTYQVKYIKVFAPNISVFALRPSLFYKYLFILMKNVVFFNNIFLYFMKTYVNISTS